MPVAALVIVNVNEYNIGINEMEKKENKKEEKVEEKVDTPKDVSTNTDTPAKKIKLKIKKL